MGVGGVGRGQPAEQPHLSIPAHADRLALAVNFERPHNEQRKAEAHEESADQVADLM